MLKEILQEYGLDFNAVDIEPFGSGLINNTWKINRQDKDQAYILQRINDNVFKAPEDFALHLQYASPAQKARPAPRRITTRILGSSCSASSTA